LCCKDWFEADPRNRGHQRYCSKAACRRASHTASQRRWLSKPENRDYFRGPINVARVQAWREAHPDYGQRAKLYERCALQDDCRAQDTDCSLQSAHLALQEIIRAQPLVLLGLIAHLSDSTLQEDMAAATRRLVKLGRDVVGAHMPHGAAAHGDVRVGA
jgi:hypothetical protein